CRRWSICNTPPADENPFSLFEAHRRAGADRVQARRRGETRRAGVVARSALGERARVSLRLGDQDDDLSHVVSGRRSLRRLRALARRHYLGKAGAECFQRRCASRRTHRGHAGRRRGLRQRRAPGFVAIQRSLGPAHAESGVRARRSAPAVQAVRFYRPRLLRGFFHRRNLLRAGGGKSAAAAAQISRQKQPQNLAQRRGAGVQGRAHQQVRGTHKNLRERRRGPDQTVRRLFRERGFCPLDRAGDDEDRLAQERGFHWADFYGLCAFNYGDGYLGLLWIFYIDHELEHGTHRGRIEVFLAASDDGKSWRRLSDTPLIPLGAESWDSGMITTATQPLFLDDEIRVYYGGANFDHAAGEKDNPYDEEKHRFSIGFTRLRKDGFVYATSSEGTLTTRALELRAGRIKVNADCRGGRIAVAVLRSDGPAETFTLADVDAVEQIFRTSIKGKAGLQVNIQNARLYSIEIE